SYIHRCGRSGRVGKKGKSIICCSPQQFALFKKLLKDIEKEKMPSIEVNSDIYIQLKPIVKLANNMELDCYRNKKTKSDATWTETIVKNADILETNENDSDTERNKCKIDKLSKWNKSKLNKMILNFDNFMKRIVRLWDILNLVPIAIIFIFILLKLPSHVRILKKPSPIFIIFYILLNSFIIFSFIKIAVSMITLDFSTPNHTVNRIIWLLTRSILNFSEIYIIMFAFCGRFDNARSMKIVLFKSLIFVLLFIIFMAIGEFSFYDVRFLLDNKCVNFAHGGTIYNAIFGLIMAIIYLWIIISRKFKRKREIPTKSLFYYYCSVLLLIHCLNAFGACMFFFHLNVGLCVIISANFIMHTCYPILIYHNFLKSIVQRTTLIDQPITIGWIDTFPHEVESIPINPDHVSPWAITDKFTKLPMSIDLDHPDIPNMNETEANI
ncbi:Transmembrane protein adipocyte-associated 1, partial [Intoshia linei]